MDGRGLRGGRARFFAKLLKKFSKRRYGIEKTDDMENKRKESTQING